MFAFFFLLMGCEAVIIPEDFHYIEIQTPTYRLASWQRIMNQTQPVHVYLEGDGHAFNYAGQPTSDPTPMGTFFRKMAFHDPHPNVVYLARPCQYVKTNSCMEKDWTTGRFSQKIVAATTAAIRSVTRGQPIVLIGYSGGALLSGLVINQNDDLPIQKWVTVAGVLNHTQWTQQLQLPLLTDSIDLQTLPKIKQIHYVAENDEVVPLNLAQSLVPPENLVIVPKATHDQGFQNVYTDIYKNAAIN